MELTRRPRPADPEFDSSPAPIVRLRDFDPLDQQRLVVNPFLAVFGLVVLTAMVRRLLVSSFPPVAVLMVALLVILPYLIQYHCLDCGQTGPYPRRDRHACPAVLARWNEGRRPRFPSSRSQLVVWGWVIGSAALLLAVQGWD